MNTRHTRVGAGIATTLLALVCLLSSSCITRDIAHGEPSLKNSFTTRVRAGAVDKVDLLFAIDNSSSMGDKQAILRDAIPDLLERLVRPRCLDEAKTVVGAYDPGAGCPTGSEPEFRPVRDLHVGIVSSSLGALGGSTCSDARGHENDRGRLIARTKPGELPVAASGPRGFLAYLPDVPENAGRPRDPNVVGAQPFTDPKPLVEAFQRLVVGVGEDGCGYEAQLESMYRFLVEPDPYESVVRDGARPLQGIDGELLQQRRAFLRPDSLVAVVLVTDENESTVDPNWNGAWRFLDSEPLPPGTRACLDDPATSGCVSCASENARGDSRCVTEPVLIGDHPNVRFFDPKTRFGVDPRFRLSRYVDGLSKERVPSRSDPSKTCLNPLFAEKLPAPGEELCNLERGPRFDRDVIFTVIGGVAWQLLTERPSDLSRGNPAPFKTALDERDYAALLGPRDELRRFPLAHPLLRESLGRRDGAEPDGAHDREWDTGGTELQYACTFELPEAEECAPNDDGCDCGRPTDSPLCDPNRPTRQLRGKAYPSLSAIAVARELAERSIVASICPREMRDRASAQYGYRPVMSTLVQRIGSGLEGPCVPPLHPDADGMVACLVLEAQPKGVSDCDLARGRRRADPATVAGIAELSTSPFTDRTVCVVDQIDSVARVGGTCANAATPGYCYVKGEEAPDACNTALAFSKLGAPLPNVSIFFQCIDARN